MKYTENESMSHVEMEMLGREVSKESYRGDAPHVENVEDGGKRTMEMRCGTKKDDEGQGRNARFKTEVEKSKKV